MDALRLEVQFHSVNVWECQAVECGGADFLLIPSINSPVIPVVPVIPVIPVVQAVG